MPRFSANLGFLWPDRPLLDRIDAAAAAGFRAIRLDLVRRSGPSEAEYVATSHEEIVSYLEQVGGQR